MKHHASKPRAIVRAPSTICIDFNREMLSKGAPNRKPETARKAQLTNIQRQPAIPLFPDKRVKRYAKIALNPPITTEKM
jgi:hypothetical protein